MATYSSNVSLRLGCLRTLRAVLRTRLLTILDALGVERTTHSVVTDTREILDTTTADQDNGVLLQVVVRRTLHTFRSAEFGFFGVVV